MESVLPRDELQRIQSLVYTRGFNGISHAVDTIEKLLASDQSLRELAEIGCEEMRIAQGYESNQRLMREGFTAGLADEPNKHPDNEWWLMGWRAGQLFVSQARLAELERRLIYAQTELEAVSEMYIENQTRGK